MFSNILLNRNFIIFSLKFFEFKNCEFGIWYRKSYSVPKTKSINFENGNILWGILSFMTKTKTTIKYQLYRDMYLRGASVKQKYKKCKCKIDGVCKGYQT